MGLEEIVPSLLTVLPDQPWLFPSRPSRLPGRPPSWPCSSMRHQLLPSSRSGAAAPSLCSSSSVLRRQQSLHWFLRRSLHLPLFLSSSTIDFLLPPPTPLPLFLFRLGRVLAALLPPLCSVDSS
eukprot:3887363-Rhodomonas_salina.1